MKFSHVLEILAITKEEMRHATMVYVQRCSGATKIILDMRIFGSISKAPSQLQSLSFHTVYIAADASQNRVKVKN